ncbi:alkaline phosphatase family protein, partial [Thermoproteota archaeon]
FVTPDYDKYCISNIPATILNTFNITQKNGNHIVDLELKSILDGVNRVILLIIDSLGYNQMVQYLNVNGSHLHHFIDKAVLLPLTSTFASTTPTALTSLSTGLTPQQHAITGYSMYLKQLGLVANMVNFSPSNKTQPNSLIDVGLDPSNFLEAKTLHEIFIKEGYKSHVVTRRIFRNSALTQMIHKGANIKTYVDTSDFFIHLKRLLESKPSEESYIFAYWDTLDTISHVYGPSSEEVDATIRNLFYSMKNELLDRVDKGATKKTILLIASDHGHHTFVNNKTIKISDHSKLIRDLQIPPTGSSRAAYLYPKSGKLEDIKKYFYTHFKDNFLLLESEDALKQGLFGRGTINEETKDRIGEIIVLPKKGSALYYSYKPENNHRFLKGGHGGLMEDEMMTPLLAIHLK